MNIGYQIIKREVLNYRWAFLLQLLLICGFTSACNQTFVPKTEVVVQPALPTPTLEPTFTPSPATRSNLPALPPNTLIEASATPSSNQGALSGRILDHNTNQSVANAQVSAGTASTTTDVDGRYTLTDLPPGQYVTSVTHPDYDPGLSSIFAIAGGEEYVMDISLYKPDTSPYPEDPMRTNPLDPNGAHTPEDAERLARAQGMMGKIVSLRETKLTGEYLVNYKIGDDVRAAVAEIDHDVWEFIDDNGRTWWIIKVCGNLASPLPGQEPIATPVPKPMPLMAEVLIEGLVVRECAAENCSEVGSVPGGEQVQVFGCLAHETGDWCEVGWSGVRGWCTGQSLRQLAVAAVIPETAPVLPTPPPTPAVAMLDKAKIIPDCEEFASGSYTQSMENLISVIVAGKPDYRNGAMVPLPICDSPQPKTLKVTIESAISEAGTPLVEPPRFYLFRSLTRSVPDQTIHSHNYVMANVEQDYILNSGWSLEAEVTLGLYLLVFEHDSYDDLINPRSPDEIPQSVTYHLDIVTPP